MIAVLLVAEVGLRALDSRLPEPLDWYAVQPQHLIDEMERLDELGLRSDVVFVGSSMVGKGIDVPVIETNLGTASRVHNVALSSAQPSVVKPWLTQEVVPRIHPGRVVWGVSSWEFNPNVPEPTIERYEMSRATRAGFFGAADRLLSRVSMLSRFRSFLRLDNGINGLVSPPAPFRESLKESPAEELLSRVQVEGDRRTPEELARIKANALLNWELGGSELAAFIDTINQMSSSGVETVVALLPVPSEYVEAHPNGQEDHDAFRSKILALGREHGFVVLDFGRVYPDSSFKDYTHLRPIGAKVFSAELAAALSGLGW